MAIKDSITALTSCKFTEDFDESEANCFIKKWVGWGIYILREKYFRIRDFQVFLSSSLEGCFLAYLQMVKEFNCKGSEKIQRAIVSSRVRQSMYRQLVYFGYIPDKKRVFYPKEWIDLHTYLQIENGYRSSSAVFDMEQLLSANIFTETETLFINMRLKGMDNREIASETNYGMRHIALTFEKITGKLAHISENSFIKKEKWGRIGPYKKSGSLEKKDM